MLAGGRFAILSPPAFGGAVSVDWLPTTKEFMVAWMDQNSYANFARRISQSGAFIGGPIELTGGLAGIGNFEPQVIANRVNNEFLIAWYNSYKDVYVRRYKPYAPPTPPGPPSAPQPGDTATGVATNAQLTWTAGSNTVSHDVYWGTTNPPPFRLNQTSTTYDPGILTTTTTYYWRINEISASGTTLGPIWTFTTAGMSSCLTDHFAYGNGNLNGKGGWSGSAGAEISVADQTVRISGGTTSVDAVRSGLTCADPGTGVIPLSFKVHAGSGVDIVWSLWIDDTASTNMVRWYGSGTSARGRVGSTTITTPAQTLTGGWDDLLVRINPSAKTAAFFFNGAPIGTLDYSSQGTSNVIGRVRFERPGSSTTAGDYLSFDDLVLGELLLPEQASNPSPANGATNVSTRSTLLWTAGANTASHDVYFGTTSPGTLRGNQSGTSFDPGALAPNTTYYWRIDEKNVDGTTTGAVWSLTTNSLYAADFDSDGDVDQSDFGLFQPVCPAAGAATTRIVV